jgi:predicted metal-dependent peptidase
MFKLSAEDKLRKSRNTIYTNRGGCIMAPVLSMGESSIVDDIPTACTNGRDKQYGRKFMESLDDIREVIGVDMHEGAHILLRHMQRHPDLIEEDFDLFNAAADYADNDFLYQIPGYGVWFILPKGHLYDKKFHGWSVREIYNFLKKGQDKDNPENDPQDGDEPTDCTMPDGSKGREVNGKKYKTETLDQHDAKGYQDMTPEEQGKLEEQIVQAINEASILCGAQDMSAPRQLNQAQNTEADWRQVTQEFFQNAMRGKDDATLTRFNRKRLVDDLYMASPYTERMGRVIIANDTSGSIQDEALVSFMSHMARVGEQCAPDAIDVLWWGTRVVGHQTLEGSYSNLPSVLKPVGGGGTHVSSVAEYIKDNKMDADCVIVLTDGYVEYNVTWPISIPTLWLVTENDSFVPPVGQVVNFR